MRIPELVLQQFGNNVSGRLQICLLAVELYLQ